jgi:hypothetical protein
MRCSNSWVDRGRQYSVIIDGQVVGKVKPGERVRFGVPAGEREIFLKIDWAKSKSFRANLAPGQTIVLNCGAPSLASLPFALTIGRKNYIRLAPEQSSADPGGN